MKKERWIFVSTLFLYTFSSSLDIIKSSQNKKGGN